MTLKTFLLCFVSFSIIYPAIAQQKYKGTLVSKLGQELNGEIIINLKGENPELIPVTTIEKTKGKGFKQMTSTTTKLNVAIIRHIVINGKTYYLRNIKIGYDDKKLNNVCMQLIHGTITSGIFQSGSGAEIHSIAIKFPDEELPELASSDFEYYSTSVGIPMRFSSCEPLVNKMLENNETVSWNKTNSREQRIQRFKNIITEFNQCASKAD